MALLLSIVAFIVLTATIILFGYRHYVVAGRIYESLGKSAGSELAAANPAHTDFFSVKKLVTSIARRLPASAQTTSALRLKLMAAGYRDRGSVAFMWGLKVLAMAAIGLCMLLVEIHAGAGVPFRIAGVLIGFAAGFRLPDFILVRRIARRTARLRRGLPDALDLIVVCAEAGLTIDRAFRNVTHHLAVAHPELTDELSLVTAEINAGLRRKEALENLAIRTQEPEIRKFVAVVAQADRYGTSMSDALRTHAEFLRVTRRLQAEEKAAKVGVKMIFPIFFFLLPCILLVSIGPAVIVIVKHLVPTLTGVPR